MRGQAGRPPPPGHGASSDRASLLPKILKAEAELTTIVQMTVSAGSGDLETLSQVVDASRGRDADGTGPRS